MNSQNNDTSDDLIKKWINKEITTKEFLKNSKPKEKKKKITYPEYKCECVGYYLSCKHCQKRVREEGYSKVDMYGDDYFENESDIMQSNYERWHC